MIQHLRMDIEPQKTKIASDAIAIWSITPKGKILGEKIKAELYGSIHFVSVKTSGETRYGEDTITFESLSQKLLSEFHNFSGHVFIFSSGIAVRLIAPLLNSKIMDPAVVVTDDAGNHVISLISGHLGGANVLARKIAAIVSGTPVITTATDTNNLPAIDLIAQNKKLFIETPENIKHISMAFLMGEPVKLVDPFNFIKTDLPEIFWTAKNLKKNPAGKIFCSYKTKKVSRETLILRPPVLSVGIGCNRGTSYTVINEFLLWVLETHGLCVNSIFKFATSDIKKDEKGLLMLSEKMKIPIAFYDKKALNSVKTIVTPSKMVEKHLGIKSVCEAAAIMAANHGNLIVSKKKNKDVTIAVAIKK